jgi:hypothetical protein
MRLRSPRSLAAGAIALVLLAGGATALAKSGSSPSSLSTNRPTIERGLFAAPLGRDLFATSLTRRIVVGRQVAACGLPVPVGDPLKAAADYLGLSVDQLTNELQAGASLAELATDHGKSVDGLEQAVIDAAKADLDKSVASGDITAEQEQQMLSDLRSHIDDLVNRKGGVLFPPPSRRSATRSRRPRITSDSPSTSWARSCRTASPLLTSRGSKASRLTGSSRP